MLYANIKITEELEQMFYARETIMSKYGFNGFTYNDNKEITNWDKYVECENRMYARAFSSFGQDFDRKTLINYQVEKDNAQKDMIELLGLTHRCELLLMKMKK